MTALLIIWGETQSQQLIHHLLLQTEMPKLGHYIALADQSEQVPAGGACLGNHSSQSGTADAHVENRQEENVQYNIDCGRNGEGDQRSFTVTQRR